MAERLYRVRNPNGSELGPALPLEVCTWITDGRIMLDAVVSETGGERYIPITQYPLFAKAFEARYGVGGGLHGSDSTPQAGSPLAIPSLATTPAGPPAPIPQSLILDLSDLTKRIPNDVTTSDENVAVLPVPDAMISDSSSESSDTTPVQLVSMDSFDSMAGGARLHEKIDSRDLPAISGDHDTSTFAGIPDDPPTPITHDAPALEDLEKHGTTGDLDPRTPITQNGLDGLTPVDAGVMVDETSDRVHKDPATAAIRPSSLRRPILDSSTAVPSMPGTPVSLEAVSASALPIVESVVAPAPIPAPAATLQLAVPVPSSKNRIAKKRIQIAAAASALGFALLFTAGVLSELGVAEAQYSASSGFFYVRVLLLASAGIGLAVWLLDRLPFTNATLSVSPRWLLLAIAAGGVAGTLSPIQHIKWTIPVALSMTFLHTVAEEAYFRMFLDRVLQRSLGGIVRPALIGGAAFGVYQLTYASIWAGRTVFEAVFWAIAMTLIAGIPYSLIHFYSRSLIPPFLCHLTANVVMIALSTM